ncbi:AraC family transcriptional regulator [Alkalihalobacillus oceani]|uniref:AraC family transcriptional regulator n=1 Tax=Halalkalibacter oceani TaxID=1653776 RepID=A0A9X2DPK0_9BACI|nr:AraC family transcriptional regulator [Halalkalibacter oceani]MCM3713760.1 AraC family transcriptional regulator [Halalkalibacter oceani]
MEIRTAEMLLQYFSKYYMRIESIMKVVHKPKVKSRGWRNSEYSGFIFPVRGEAIFHFNETTYNVKPGSIIHAGPYMRNDREVVGDEDWVYVLVLYKSLKIKDDAEDDLSTKHFQISSIEHMRIIDNLNKLVHYWQSPASYYSLRIQEIWFNTLNLMVSTMENFGRSDNKQILERILDDIHENYEKALSVSILAERHQINVNQIAYLFQKYLSMPPGEYLNHYRLNKAKELLSSKDVRYKVKEVAEMVGFTDQLYFSRRFKKHFGISPKAYVNIIFHE